MKERIFNIFSGSRTHARQRPAGTATPRIWAVGGGKGGVGKSVVASNLGALMASTGRRTLLVDGDLGSANLHTLVNAAQARNALSDFLKGGFEDLGNAVSGTGIGNLDLISGAKDSTDVSWTGDRQVSRLIEAIKGLDYDSVIIDTAPGTSPAVLDLFLASTEGILVMTPERTSVENMYRFIKCLLIRKVRTVHEADNSGRLKGLLERVFNRASGKPRTISGLVKEIAAADAEQGRILGSHLRSTRLFTVVNQTDGPDDEQAGLSVERACYDYFGLNVPSLGHIPFDKAVRDSIKAGVPVVRSFALSQAAARMEGVFDAIVKNNKDAAAI